MLRLIWYGAGYTTVICKSSM